MSDRHEAVVNAVKELVNAVKELNVQLKELHDMGFRYRRVHSDTSSPDEFVPLVIRIVEM